VQKEVNQEESEHNEVDGMKKAADSTGEVMHIGLSTPRREERPTSRRLGSSSPSSGTAAGHSTVRSLPRLARVG